MITQRAQPDGILSDLIRAEEPFHIAKSFGWVAVRTVVFEMLPVLNQTTRGGHIPMAIVDNGLRVDVVYVYTHILETPRIGPSEFLPWYQK